MHTTLLNVLVSGQEHKAQATKSEAETPKATAFSDVFQSTRAAAKVAEAGPAKPEADNGAAETTPDGDETANPAEAEADPSPDLRSPDDDAPRAKPNADTTAGRHASIQNEQPEATLLEVKKPDFEGTGRSERPVRNSIEPTGIRQDLDAPRGLQLSEKQPVVPTRASKATPGTEQKQQVTARTDQNPVELKAQAPAISADSRTVARQDLNGATQVRASVQEHNRAEANIQKLAQPAAGNQQQPKSQATSLISTERATTPKPASAITEQSAPKTGVSPQKAASLRPNPVEAQTVTANQSRGKLSVPTDSVSPKTGEKAERLVPGGNQVPGQQSNRTEIVHPQSTRLAPIRNEQTTEVPPSASRSSASPVSTGGLASNPISASDAYSTADAFNTRDVKTAPPHVKAQTEGTRGSTQVTARDDKMISRTPIPAAQDGAVETTPSMVRRIRAPGRAQTEKSVAVQQPAEPLKVSRTASTITVPNPQQTKVAAPGKHQQPEPTVTARTTSTATPVKLTEFTAPQIRSQATPEKAVVNAQTAIVEPPLPVDNNTQKRALPESQSPGAPVMPVGKLMAQGSTPTSADQPRPRVTPQAVNPTPRDESSQLVLEDPSILEPRPAADQSQGIFRSTRATPFPQSGTGNLANNLPPASHEHRAPQLQTGFTAEAPEVAEFRRSQPVHRENIYPNGTMSETAAFAPLNTAQKAEPGRRFMTTEERREKGASTLSGSTSVSHAATAQPSVTSPPVRPAPPAPALNGTGDPMMVDPSAANLAIPEEELAVGQTGRSEGWGAAPAPTTHVSLTHSLISQPRAAMSQMAEIITRHGDGGVDVSINPEELGRVRMSLAATDHAVTLTMNFERPETMELIRRHIDLLANDLRRMGYDSLSFDFRQDGNNAGGQHFSDQQQTPSSSTTEAPLRPEHPQTPAVDDGLDLRL